jgi:hypothetical protein
MKVHEGYISIEHGETIQPLLPKIDWVLQAVTEASRLPGGDVRDNLLRALTDVLKLLAHPPFIATGKADGVDPQRL